MENLIGRATEIKILTDALASPQAELIAVYGRRRVGKTHLIRTVYEKQIAFEFTGAKGIDIKEQLNNFTATAQAAFKLNLAVPIATCRI
jgi:uncharacterized protein